MRRDLEIRPLKKNIQDVGPQLRRLAHDLGNSLEAILQACYLLKQTPLNVAGKRWVGMIESSVGDAARTNRSLRELLQSSTDKPSAKRRDVRKHPDGA